MKEIEMDKLKKLARFTRKIKNEYLIGVLPSQLIHKLKEQKVDVVIDIRATVRTPMIYMPKYFEDILSIVGINYIRFQKLGNPSKLRKKAQDDYILAKRLYLNYIRKNSKAQDQLSALFKKLRHRKNYCLVCTCDTEDKNRCHRFWLKELLINIKRKKLDLEENYKLDFKPIPTIQEGN